MSLCRFNGEVALFFACLHIFWKRKTVRGVTSHPDHRLHSFCSQKWIYFVFRLGFEPRTFRLCAYSAAPEAHCSLLTCSRHEKQLCLSILCCKHVNSYFVADLPNLGDFTAGKFHNKLNSDTYNKLWFYIFYACFVLLQLIIRCNRLYL